MSDNIISITNVEELLYGIFPENILIDLPRPGSKFEFAWSKPLYREAPIIISIIDNVTVELLWYDRRFPKDQPIQYVEYRSKTGAGEGVLKHAVKVAISHRPFPNSVEFKRVFIPKVFRYNLKLPHSITRYSTESTGRQKFTGVSTLIKSKNPKLKEIIIINIRRDIARETLRNVINHAKGMIHRIIVENSKFINQNNYVRESSKRTT